MHKTCATVEGAYNAYTFFIPFVDAPLKSLFGSQTRVKLLQTFLLNPESEYFVRELTRKLGEQINSIRRELMNLKKIGLLKSRIHNRKKFFYVDKSFLLYSELRHIFTKSRDPKADIARSIDRLGRVHLIVLTGVFAEQKSKVDLVIIGEIEKEELESYLDQNVSKDVRYAMFDKENFLYRLEYRDKFMFDLLRNPKNIIPINRLQKQIVRYFPED